MSYMTGEEEAPINPKLEALWEQLQVFDMRKVDPKSFPQDVLDFWKTSPPNGPLLPPCPPSTSSSGDTTPTSLISTDFRSTTSASKKLSSFQDNIIDSNERHPKKYKRGFSAHTGSSTPSPCVYHIYNSSTLMIWWNGESDYASRAPFHACVEAMGRAWDEEEEALQRMEEWRIERWVRRFRRTVEVCIHNWRYRAYYRRLGEAGARNRPRVRER